MDSLYYCFDDHRINTMPKNKSKTRETEIVNKNFEDPKILNKEYKYN